MSKFVYKKITKLIRINSELHRVLKVAAAREGLTLKALIENFLNSSTHLKNFTDTNSNENK